jgi:hypothetical protein
MKLLPVYIVIFFSYQLNGQNNDVNWYSVNNGGNTSVIGNARIKAVVGQALINVNKYNNSKVVSGFFGYTTIPPFLSIVNDEREASDNLFQNTPNPFNQSTRIKYFLDAQTFVTLTIYDLYGKKIYEPVNSFQTTGFYEVSWNGQTESNEYVPSGSYYYTLVMRSGYIYSIQSKSMVFIR